MILSQQLTINSSKNLTRSAIRYLGKEINYKTLNASISRLSYLHQRELGTGIRIAILCRNSLSLVASFFAFTNIRAVIIPIDPDLPPADIEKWLVETEATHIAVTSDLVGYARDIQKGAKMTLPLVEIDKKKGGEYDTSFTPMPEQTPQENDPILLLRSGGVSGKPKYVIFTHKQLIAAAAGLKGHYKLTANDRFLTTMSWHHPFALTHGMLFPILSASTLVIDHGLQATEFLDFILESKVTRLIGISPFFLKLLLTCKSEKRVLPGVKSITVGLGSLSAQIKKTFDLLKVPVLHCYGQIENLWTIAMQPSDNPGELAEGYVRGYVGKGLPGCKYKVVDANGDEILGKERRTGPLALTSPTAMQGYFGKKDKELNKMVLRGTWLYTGDIARLEGEGETLTITFICRKENYFVVNGAPVLFSDLDLSLKENTAVKEGAFFAVKNSRGVPVLVCAVVKKPGRTLSEDIFMQFCRATYPSHLVPHGVAFTDTIARDAGNNVNYHKLRGQFSGLGG